MTTEDFSDIDRWLTQAKTGELTWTEFAERVLARSPGTFNTTDADSDRPGLDRPDVDRFRRCGFGEVIFGEGKSPDSVTHIARSLLDSGQTEVLVTRADELVVSAVKATFPHCRHDPVARTLRISDEPIAQTRRIESAASDHEPPSPAPPSIAVITAGSTDLPVGLEALETLRWMGVDALFFTDIGVAGPYRLLTHIEQLRQCAVVVVIAGMEGALASVVGGLVACPVIAVPTSVGYGANLQGITTLLSMMSSCAAGVTVVNIDAGFKGGYVAGLMAHQICTASKATSDNQ